MKKIFRLSLESILLYGVLFSACTHQPGKKEILLKSMRLSLESSNKVIFTGSLTALNSLENKRADYSMTERANIWLPKAIQVAKLSKEIYDHINNLKITSKIEPQKKQLLNHLIKYKKDVLNIDPSIRHEFEKNIMPTASSYDSTEKENQRFYYDFFVSGNEYDLAILTGLQNDIRITENKVINFCNNQVGRVDGPGFFNTFSAIVGQNSTVLKAGENIEITAGVGSFSKTNRPEIIINGEKTELTELGFSKYKTLVPDKPGKYSIPVLISYTDFNGQRQTHKIPIEYTVTKPCDQ